LRHRDPEAEEIARALEPGWLGIDAAVILGSGLGGGADALQVAAAVSWQDLPGLADAAVPGHEGRLLLGTGAGLRVALFQGRKHVYEGLTAARAALPARVAAALGARVLVMASAVGAVDPALGPGTWVFVDDHLNLLGRNPLEGVRGPGGPAFVDLTDAYRSDLFEGISARLGARGVALSRGILAAFPGPSYETPAEVRMARLLGASVVGMSTVPEAVWGRYLGLDVIAFGRVSNLAAGVGPGRLDHVAVLREGVRGGGEAAAAVEAALAAWQAARRGSTEQGANAGGG
jgi:purine-nucleoside phosphorylase